MKLSILILTGLLSSSVFAKSPLKIFSSLFNEANCVDESSIGLTRIDPKDFLYQAYYEAKENTDETDDIFISYARKTKTSYFKSIVDTFETGVEMYCMKPGKAIKALNYLVKSFNQVEGILLEDKDTGDDDSTTYFTIVMKDGSFTSLYFGN